MRETSGGVEFGCDWVIKELISENLSPINVDEEFEESIRQCYPETITVLWMELDAVMVAKDSDPTAWRIAKDEWLDQEVSENLLMEIDSNYYRISDIEEYLDQELNE